MIRIIPEEFTNLMKETVSYGAPSLASNENVKTENLHSYIARGKCV